MNSHPPLRLLAAFAAVARAGSMREAAGALNVSQPAVTQALKALEDHVGAPLLDRGRKPARLNAEGRLLADAVGEGLDLISRALEEIRETACADSSQLTVACTLGMATYWLMPRLPAFYRLNPDVIVNVQAPPNDLPSLDGDIDLALRYGRGEWSDGKTTRLFDEVICPVGQPDLVAALHERGEGLERAPLIHVRSPQNPGWVGWGDYFPAMGLMRRDLRGAVFDNYVQAVQAATDGRGLMLGWRSITQALVDDGALVRWSEAELRPRAGYHATFTRKAAAKPAAEAMLAWLLAECA